MYISNKVFPECLSHFLIPISFGWRRLCTHNWNYQRILRPRLLRSWMSQELYSVV